MDGWIALDPYVQNNLHVILSAAELDGMIKQLLSNTSSPKVVVYSKSADFGDTILYTLDANHSHDF